MENTSGQGAAAAVPAEIDRWNWGAFLLHWVWGIGNNTFIALLAFVPLVNLIIPFVLGARGSAWAWRNKRWDSVEEFRRVQRAWAKWAVILYLAMVGMLVLMIFGLSASFKSSDAFQMSLSTLRANDDAMAMLGRPLDTGFPMGSIETSGGSGHANLNYSVSGPKGSGTIYAEAHKRQGAWTLTSVTFVPDDSAETMELVE
ncbi:MAG: hypothetical protein IPK97_18395 [Ahniella sp.]|nr:hypothetical protein [Ahniella sp.]